MNPSLIAIIGVFVGIISTYLFGFLFKKYSLGFIGNTIIGVFGSVFVTKLVSRFDINPFLISQNNHFNLSLFILYLCFAMIGAIVFQIIAKRVLMS